MPSPLRPVQGDLTHKDSEWKWTAEHEEAFLKLKKTIMNGPVLKYYNPNDELTVQCDTSDTGLGTALIQMGEPVAWMSSIWLENTCY